VGLRLDAAHREYVSREQLRMVLLHTRVGTVAATVFALVLAQHLHGTLPGAEVQAWLALKLLVAGARMMLAQAYGRWGDESPQRRRWENAMLWLLAVDGLVWGLAAWRLSGQPVAVAALGVAALNAVACIATFGLQVRLAATAAYVVPILLPMTWGLAVRSDGIAHVAALGQFILLAVLLATARATSQRLAEGMLLRQQADRLVAEKDAALRLVSERTAERDRFLAKVSHELRTPLHGILGVARLMHLASDDAIANRRLELIEGSGRHLQGLIDDLLEASVIQAGQFVLHDADFELSAELEQLAEVFAHRAAAKGLGFDVKIDVPRPCWVRGDASRLRQVLHNLLGNAVKFTDAGHIDLAVGPGPRPGLWRMTVTDTGPGLDDAELQRVFQPFQQAGASRMADGVGLGLTIAREIAVAMGGDVTVQSVRGAGASFHFDVLLPASSPTADGARVSAQQQPDRPDSRTLPRHVLVAEDDEVNAMIVCAFLDSLGVRSERVSDGQQALQQALREVDPPDVLLMDCHMPVLDGLAASIAIRQQEQRSGRSRLPIVALTAADGEADRAACMAAGMDLVIGKPFTRDQLSSALRDVGAAPAPPPSAAAAGQAPRTA